MKIEINVEYLESLSTDELEVEAKDLRESLIEGGYTKKCYEAEDKCTLKTIEKILKQRCN